VGYLCSKSIATSHSTPYNLTGNLQVEQFNGIIWKIVTLALKARGLLPNQGESVLLAHTR